MFSAKDIFQTKAKGGYTIAKSLRFRSSASAYLSRTNASSPTNSIKWTLSVWAKRGALGATQNIIGATNSGSDDTYLQFGSSDKIVFGSYTGAGTDYGITTAAVFRDPSAWYHIVFVFDAANATASSRAMIYVNGILQTVTNSANGTWPQNSTNNKINTASQVVNIARRSLADNYLDGYISEVNFIDGQALDPTYFGQTDTATGVWMPKAYTGSYGTNGFYLKFTDVGSTTAGGANTGYGKDFAGTNNWTTNNFGTTSTLTTYDSMVDTPTNYDNGGNGAGNYCVLSPIDKNSDITMSNGNLDYSHAANALGYPTSTFYMSSGKWYWEVTTSSLYSIIGVCPSTAGLTANLFTANGGYGYYQSGNKYINGAATAYGATFTTGDTIGVALDVDGSTITFYKNGTSQGAISITSGLTWKVCGGNGSSAAVATGSFNFGQRPFTYTPPSGFKALCTQNLPTPTIGATSSTLANKYFDATLWTGDGTVPRPLTNSGLMQPDLVWVKARGSSTFSDHVLNDAVRGATKDLYSNLTAAEALNNSVMSFNSNGFSVGDSSRVNQSSIAYVGWQWKANGSGSSNTSGSITSTVSANVTAGFSVVTYTGSSTTGTVGHGLGVAPKMIIVKTRNAVADWYVYHASNGANKYMYMNLTNAVISNAGYFDTVSSTVFGGTSAAGIISTSNFVAYCFAEVAGYSKFGSYTGNGSADGPFVYCGFRPRYILTKRTDTTGNWEIYDTSRDTYNVMSADLSAESSAAETSTARFDALSNGFKIRTTGAATNASGGTYIFAVFAETPFNYSRGR